jgi:hypothetical protein
VSVPLSVNSQKSLPSNLFLKLPLRLWDNSANVDPVQGHCARYQKRTKDHSRSNMSKVLLLVVVSSILIAVFLLHQLRYIYILPIPEYEGKPGTRDPFAVCEMIKDRQLQDLCFTASKGKDFKDGLRLAAKGRVNPSRDFPWYYYDGYFPEGVKGVLVETVGRDPDSRCSKISSRRTGKPIMEEYYLCRAFLENPYFCEKLPPNDRLINHCYEDSALIWQDPYLCEKAHPEEKDFCRLRVALMYLNSKKGREIHAPL